LTFLKLPLSAGRSWDVVNLSKSAVIDTVITSMTLKLKADAAAEGTASVGTPLWGAVGKTQLSCFPITSTVQLDVPVVFDSTLSFGGQILKQKGDMAMRLSTTSTTTYTMSAKYTIPVSTRSVTVSCDTNCVFVSSNRDTVRSHTQVVSLYDPKAKVTVEK
jgi:hypothetical protein